MQTNAFAQEANPLPARSDAAAGRLLTAQVLIVSAYVAAQMLANVASVKIGVVAGLAVDMGTFIYPVTFTLRDLAHKALGKAATRALILAAGGVNLLMAVYLMWAAAVPSDPSWGLGEAFSAVLGPMWRIVTASILAQVLSELADTEVYSWFVRTITARFQWLRVLVSNSVSVPVDNLVFALGAFAFALPWGVVWEIFAFNMLVKYGLTLLSLPLIYLAPQRFSRDDEE
jgi:uncharacterized integral membrane protein (TIGR00697 family)